MLILLQAATPVPHDIPLPLPLPQGVLVALLVTSFLAHLLFVNMMVGGSMVTLWAQVKGLRDRAYDELAHEVAKTITVNKSLAVVLGVAPLLTINALYTVYFYSANALTGTMWIAIIPLVSVAFLLTYLHKYTWQALERNKPLHIAILAIAVAVFLFIPLIFLVNINLMLFPEKWGTVRGFLSALTLPNVFPRYLHFIFASLSVTGLFLFWYLGRASYPFEERLPGLRRADIQRKAYSLTLAASVVQFLLGPLVLLTLPSKGVSWTLVLVIFTGAGIALPAMWWMWKAITGPDEAINRHSGKVLLAMSLTVLFMGSGRHVYRATALAPHQALMAEQTKAFHEASALARAQAAAGAKAAPVSDDPAAAGLAVFTQNCSACHKVDAKLVGPPVVEMARIYGSDRDGLKAWIKAPGKKRPDAPQMPGFPQLSPDQLEQLSAYIFSVSKP